VTDATLEALIACPSCRGTLRQDADRFVCTNCSTTFAQRIPGVVDLMPPSTTTPEWERRQEECDAWYRDLFRDHDRARACYEQDLTPFDADLDAMRGAVLDLGGGNGAAGALLRNTTTYVVLEPSLAWTEWDPGVMGDRYARASRTRFVRGIGEQLPFRTAVFDAVLSLWSLNHVTDPARVIEETARVSRSGATLLLVLEDMEPTWMDFALERPWRGGAGIGLRMLALKARRAKWPLQTDHIRLREDELMRWSRAHYEPVGRRWAGGYLTLTLRRR
jgi:SAM-dependent methyltransferase